ncbi:MAG: ABC transporter permease, partial [Vicinamibacteraceae bacterium]|nr:ABC transporter permease [Vicinamibacteraceae bacterium]
PPMRVRLADAASGSLRAPFFHPLRMTDQLARRYDEQRAHATPLAWFHDGRLVTSSDASRPWFPLGTDALGRDIASRLLTGARVSLGVAALAALGALAIGTLVGALAGAAGGRLDDLLMRAAELVMVLPVIYLALAVRAALPLVLSPAATFALLAGALALAGWPTVARGVRGIIAVERTREYAEAARAVGASPFRVLWRHLVPAAFPFLATQFLLLVPAFILAEATLSFVGLGFSPPTASWGAMLQEAANVRALVDAPWVLAPAGAIVVVVLGMNLVISGSGDQRIRGQRIGGSGDQRTGGSGIKAG